MEDYSLNEVSPKNKIAVPVKLKAKKEHRWRLLHVNANSIEANS